MARFGRIIAEVCQLFISSFNGVGGFFLEKAFVRTVTADDALDDADLDVWTRPFSSWDPYENGLFALGLRK